MPDRENTNLIASLSFDQGSTTYEVMECSFGFTQNYDSNNTPNGTAAIDLINLVIKASDQTEIADWMTNKNAQKTGTIEIRITESKSRKIKFTNAYCVQYNERFDNYSGSSHLISFGVLAKKIDVNTLPHCQNWD